MSSVRTSTELTQVRPDLNSLLLRVKKERLNSDRIIYSIQYLPCMCIGGTTDQGKCDQPPGAPDVVREGGARRPDPGKSKVAKRNPVCHIYFSPYLLEIAPLIEFIIIFLFSSRFERFNKVVSSIYLEGRCSDCDVAD